jgi:crossover junction endodeoxyribonuclease RuvC
MRVIMGVDVGAGGAIVVRWPGATEIHDMPCDTLRIGKKDRRRVSAARLASLFTAYHTAEIEMHVFVEQVSAMPGQGVTSMFTFGRAAGLVEGVCAARSIPVTLVSPVTWKRVMGCPAGKDGARARACQLLPELADRFARVKDDGRAEAALIALYGQRLLQQGVT